MRLLMAQQITIANPSSPVVRNGEGAAASPPPMLARPLHSLTTQGMEVSPSSSKVRSGDGVTDVKEAATESIPPAVAGSTAGDLDAPLKPLWAGLTTSTAELKESAFTPDSFLHLLHSNSGRPLFFEHLRLGFSEHHLLFWEQVQQYKRISAQLSSPLSFPPLDPLDEPLPTPLQKAQTINTRFIITGSPLQINITEQARLRIQHTLNKFIPHASPAWGTTVGRSGRVGGALPPAGLFDESEEVCVELMRGNYFYSFKETPDYQQWLQGEKKALKEGNKTTKGGKGGASKKLCTIL